MMNASAVEPLLERRRGASVEALMVPRICAANRYAICA
jgi:hypothetical protein